MKSNDDIPTTDTNEIKQLINRVKRGELDQGDGLLIEKLLNILLMIVSLFNSINTAAALSQGRRKPVNFFPYGTYGPSVRAALYMNAMGRFSFPVTLE
jgi:hypothetical protein